MILSPTVKLPMILTLLLLVKSDFAATFPPTYIVPVFELDIVPTTQLLFTLKSPLLTIFLSPDVVPRLFTVTAPSLSRLASIPPATSVLFSDTVICLQVILPVTTIVYSAPLSAKISPLIFKSPFTIRTLLLVSFLNEILATDIFPFTTTVFPLSLNSIAAFGE